MSNESLNSINLNKNSISYILKLLNVIKQSHESFKESYNTKEIKITEKKFDSKNLRNLSLYNSKYVSVNIKKKTMQDIHYEIHISIKLNKNTEINVIFYSEKPTITYDYVKYVYMVLYVLYSQKKYSCGNKLDIHIILVDEVKKLPEDKILGPDNVNSAVTTGCTINGEILIFRKEEWRKTLIHELFHILGLDFSTHFNDDNRKMAKNMFFVNSTYNIYETYCEIMALIIYNCFISYELIGKYNSYKNNTNEYVFYTEVLLSNELLFSIFQRNKILQFMNIDMELMHILKYRDHIEDLYREKTNVFCYYILKTSLLENINKFLLWITRNNETLFQFNNSQKNIEKFMKFIERLYYKKNKKPYQKMIRFGDVDIVNTLRMTINE